MGMPALQHVPGGQPLPYEPKGMAYESEAMQW